MPPRSTCRSGCFLAMNELSICNASGPVPCRAAAICASEGMRGEPPSIFHRLLRRPRVRSKSPPLCRAASRPRAMTLRVSSLTAKASAELLRRATSLSSRRGDNSRSRRSISSKASVTAASSSVSSSPIAVMTTTVPMMILLRSTVTGRSSLQKRNVKTAARARISRTTMAGRVKDKAQSSTISPIRSYSEESVMRSGTMSPTSAWPAVM